MNQFETRFIRVFSYIFLTLFSKYVHEMKRFTINRDRYRFASPSKMLEISVIHLEFTDIRTLICLNVERSVWEIP